MEDRAHDDYLPGFLLDRYRVEAILAEHEAGAVIRAFDVHLRRMVVIDALPRSREVAVVERYRIRNERLAREVEAAARVGFHTHLVAVLDHLSDDDTVYLIAEHVPGGDLVTTLRDGPLPPEEAVRIAADAADGLHAAHEAGVVHCDIRPKNIFLTARKRAKVGSFGSAQIAGDPAHTSALARYLGAPAYRSPEQERFLEPTTDQYSLGLVLFEMLIGTVYKALPPEEAASLLACEPAAIGQVLRRMLARDAEERYATMGEVARALTAVLEGGGAADSPPADRARHTGAWIVPETASNGAVDRPAYAGVGHEDVEDVNAPSAQVQAMRGAFIDANVAEAAESGIDLRSAHHQYGMSDGESAPAIRAVRHPALTALGILALALYLVVVALVVIRYFQTQPIPALPRP